MKSGVSYGDAKAIIQKQIDGALNGFKGGNGHNADPKVAPFLNKVNNLNIISKTFPIIFLCTKVFYPSLFICIAV